MLDGAAALVVVTIRDSKLIVTAVVVSSPCCCCDWWPPKLPLMLFLVVGASTEKSTPVRVHKTTQRSVSEPRTSKTALIRQSRRIRRSTSSIPHMLHETSSDPLCSSYAIQDTQAVLHEAIVDHHDGTLRQHLQGQVYRLSFVSCTRTDMTPCTNFCCGEHASIGIDR